MLEEEGVVFDGGGGKIRREFFVGSAPSPDSAQKSKTAPEVVHLQREVENAPSKSKYFSTGVTEEMLKREILNLLQERRAGATC